MICSPWIDQQDLYACGCPENAPQDVMDLAIESASEILFKLTGQQYPGECEATLRPCGNSGRSVPFGWGYPWIPLKLDGVWLNTGGCGCAMDYCGCSSYPALNLGRDDVQSVDEVIIDGVVLDPGDYRLDENRFLVRVVGSRWPCCQYLALPLDEHGTWGVTITYGWPIPADLRRAAAVLASEYVKACTSAGDCRLPMRAQTVARQGVTLQLFDPLETLNQGRTGLWEVDLAVTAHNPHRLTRQASVWSPEIERVIRG